MSPTPLDAVPSSNSDQQSFAAHILVAEDEAPLADLLRLSLEAAGHQVTLAHDGQEALRLFEQGGFDLVILDVMMPGMDGFAVCAEIRRRSDVPIIMLTALSDPDAVVQGFDLGADDYITKPFQFREVQARIAAILRRVRWLQTKWTPSVVRVGRLTVDLDAHTAATNGHVIPLTPIEFRLLYTLMAQPGKAFSREQLMREVWGYDFVGGTNLVEVTVHRLREKIERNPSRPEHIVTVRGVGYKFQPAKAA